MQDFSKKLKINNDKIDTKKKKLPIKIISAIIILLIPTSILIGRLIYLNTTDKAFLINRANFESIHSSEIHATRGLLLDRHNRPLAVSTLLYNVIFDIKVMKAYPEKYSLMSQLPFEAFSTSNITNLINKYPDRRYYIAEKYISPADAKQLKSLRIPGVYLEKNMRTFYPLENIASQLIGFTNANNQGQSGLELEYNSKLAGQSGKETIETDPYGNLIKTIDQAKSPHNGEDIRLSIDSMIQYYTYEALKKGVINAEASSGSAAVIDPHTGEILAVTSYPSYNPNEFADRAGAGVKNRAMIDTFEPGSTIKPFIAALALNLGTVTPDTTFDTSPGAYTIQGHTIHDDVDFGTIDVTKIIQKSSNIGILKIEKLIPKLAVYHYLQSLGFGGTSFMFPGINMGYLPYIPKLSELGFATISFGYAMTSSTLQLAHAYTLFANNGKLCPLSLTKINQNTDLDCKQVLKPTVASEILDMLNNVTNIHGTGILASIPGYQVGGKTGTSHQVVDGKFSKKYYNAVFAGIAPLHHPKLVIAIWIDRPLKGRFYRFGGVSAAPIFADIARKSLAYLGTPYTSDLDSYKNIQQNKQWLLKVIANN